MPELPEVEATRRYLAPVLEGAVIERVEVRRDRMTRRNQRPGDFIDRLTGRRVRCLTRRGKFLLAPLDGDITWVSHLGMSGRFSLNTPGEPEAPHTNVVIHLRSRPQVRLVDPRTFGFVAAFTPDEFARAMSAVGPDALDELPDSRALRAILTGRTAPIKALLLDQRLVAGLGNIYADEVLHRAGVAPERPGGSLSPEEVRALRAAIPMVLRAGLRHGGTSLGDLAYLLPDGRAGDYVSRLAAYGREGEPCRRCGGIIERVVVRARSSFWCRGCQR
ncbi:MAG TPA: bifunctional DNA-formamidopyrimidine glycosylase/DNA-(apurinic or apyrimidinic site) lyase [Acidimicrobiia bacterium]|nr:bifunctional DNA-formamidopyrimidine glycosylase/DNA-(apurinic or apyrimidinic site) lyase [Acidimicrobiia bacterium]